MTQEPDYLHHAVALWQAITHGKMSAVKLKNELVAAHENGKRHPTEWRPIAEALDCIKDGREIIATGYNGDKPKGGRWTLIAYWSLQEECWVSACVDDDDCHKIYEPTHYMPLPAPPEANE